VAEARGHFVDLVQRELAPLKSVARRLVKRVTEDTSGCECDV
jgi:hypothetical protein